MTDMVKRCVDCLDLKPKTLGFFDKGRSKDGFRTKCRKCVEEALEDGVEDYPAWES